MAEISEKLMEKAAELGRMIAESEEYIAYKDASGLINQDEEKKECVDTYVKLLSQIQHAVSQNNVPVELKDQYEDYARRLNNDPELTEFIRAQKEYMDLVNGCVAIISEI